LAGIKLLVAGGSGFLGSHYIRYALQTARPAVVASLDAADPARRLEDIQDRRFRREEGVREGFDVLVDLGDGGAKLAQAARRAGIGRIVQAASEEGIVGFRCSENYGPYQRPSALVPRLLLAAFEGHPLTLGGDGGTLRDWILIHDTVRAIHLLVEKGSPGQVYGIGGGTERTDLQVAQAVLRIAGAPEDRIRFGGDAEIPRPAVEPSKIERELGFRPSLPFEVGLRTTAEWYRRNLAWVRGAAAAGA
jgi:dTDP-D-glucose 4,6-dehydratase